MRLLCTFLRGIGPFWRLEKRRKESVIDGSCRVVPEELRLLSEKLGWSKYRKTNSKSESECWNELKRRDISTVEGFIYTSPVLVKGPR